MFNSTLQFANKHFTITAKGAHPWDCVEQTSLNLLLSQIIKKNLKNPIPANVQLILHQF
jgi:hypothetical protein